MPRADSPSGRDSLAVFNYLADAYGIYASSALAGQSFLRNMIAGSFPFFTEIMCVSCVDGVVFEADNAFFV
jgi:hypothetical protein